MRLRNLPLKGLLYHWRLYVGVLLGTVVAAMVMTGALLVGTSVRRSLQEAADARLGRVTHAMESEARFLSEGVAERLREKLAVPVAPLLQARAVALRRGADGRVLAAVGVNLYGIDERFRDFLPRGTGDDGLVRPNGGEAVLNERLARELAASPGDYVTLRIGNSSGLPQDAPLAGGKGRLSRLGSFVVTAVAPRDSLGDFNLRAEQVPPANVFVDLAWLQEALERSGTVNLLLVAGEEARLAAGSVNDALAAVFNLGDAGYRIRPYLSHGIVQLESERVFLDPSVAAAALEFPGAAGSLTWLVDSLALQNGPAGASTPYSFVTAVSPAAVPGVSPVPSQMEDHEIILNSWTAAELGARRGDRVKMAYSLPTPGGVFEPHSRSFIVRDILAMEEIAAERELVPAFPGLTDADSCGDWDVGMPLDEEKLADDANERYWSQYRQMPKAFITLDAGRSMWNNRWGDLTAVRYRMADNGRSPAPAPGDITVAPRSLGFVFQPAAVEAELAAANSIDFGGLFLGMSLFIIAAALTLTGMLHSFAVLQRRREVGTLLALGFSSRQVTALFFVEAFLVTAIGATIGALCGSLYTRALLIGLGGFWEDAVAGTSISYFGSAGAMAGGAGATLLASASALFLTLRRQRRYQVHELVTGGAAAEGPSFIAGRRAGWTAAGGLAAALLIILGAGSSRTADTASLFFAAGALLLVSFLAGLLWAMHRFNEQRSGSLCQGTFAFRNALRRRWRSLGTVAIFASGCFIVVAVSSMRTDMTARAHLRWSGTGGFSLYGDTVLPLPAGAMSFAGTARENEREARLDGVSVVPFKVRDGDDASCFNLNRARSPRILGVDPRPLLMRRSFVPPESSKPVWELLHLELSDGIVPALAGDNDTAMWNLALKTGAEDGDDITYTDERGEEFRVRLVGALPVRKSVLQGSIIIADSHFAERFPSVGGYRTFLFDGSVPDAGQAASLEGAFSDYGLDVLPATERLRSYYAVEHTYLDIFLLLGGLGLVLASVGLGVVVLRSVVERRAEHALLQTLGFTRRVIGQLLFLEHAGLFGAGLTAGTCAALLAVAPLLVRSPGDFSLRNLALLLAGLTVAGLSWIFVAEKLGTRQYPVTALRQEEGE